MWLQRVIFNMQARLLNKERPRVRTHVSGRTASKRRRQKERIQLVQERLLDLDRRMEALL
ncbi:MAG: hypothetical protein QNJ97_19255 [Myxococcota bacterium]|nr:hypothetical protein [Myxococcota bacterium]